MGETAEPLPVTWAEYRATAVLLGFFVATMVLAILMAGPFQDANLEAFEEPTDPMNAIIYIAMLLVFTFGILWVYKRGHKWVIQVIILGAVASTILYGFVGFGLRFGLSYNEGAIIGLIVGVASALWLWKYPEWYVIDLVGLLVAASAAALLGISLAVLPTIILLAALAVYDAIAVYKTKHMLDLADAVIERRLPVLLVIPKERGYSFRHESAAFKEANKENKGEREAMFMGLGDLVMPTILVVSALRFGVEAGWGTFPSMGAAVGTLVGFGVLMGFVLKGNPQAGLPLLNGGAIVGFLAGLMFATGSFVFW